MKKDAQKLINEALRFEARAKDAAIKSILALNTSNPDHGHYTPEAVKARKLATDHLIRAETFRAAAAIISKP